MRVLLSEGSGLTSRQVATLLGRAGHEVEVLSSTALCLARFTRHVRRVHAVPRYGDEPLAWFAAARRTAANRHIDVLLPTQEQVAVLSALEPELGLHTVVPPFPALCRVLDKVSAFETLTDAFVPQPESCIVDDREGIDAVEWFPAFVKRPIGTASSGVRRVENPQALREAIQELRTAGGRLLVQREMRGPLVMAQAVADHGRLAAFHANVRVRPGIAGGASVKESLASPELEEAVERLSARIGWHGPLSLDAILTKDGPRVIDVNPRLVEPMNAWLAGVDLVGATLRLARGETAERQPASRAGVRSRQLLLQLLGAAAEPHGRRRIALELLNALRSDVGEEELTPLAGDPIAGLPVAIVVAATLAWPRAWRWFDRGAVDSYALTPAAWQEILGATGVSPVAP